MAFLAYYVAYLRMRLWISFRNVLIRVWMRNGPPRFGMLPPTADIRPTLSIQVPSSHDPARSVAANIFYPPGASPSSGKKLPVHLHVHGSGFCYNMFPSDTEFAAYVAQKAGCVVLDTDYAKAPAHPFPAAYNDVSDVAAYILSRPDDWDLSRFTISGASSGGCLALSVAVTLPKGTTKAALTFYPATDLSNHPSGTQLVPEKPTGNPGLLLREWERRMMHLAYVPEGVDAEDPRISPIYAPVEAFPPVTIICGDCDPLLPSIQRLMAKLRDGGNDVEEMLVEGAAHAWDRLIKRDQTRWIQTRNEALDLFIRRLQGSWPVQVLDSDGYPSAGQRTISGVNEHQVYEQYVHACPARMVHTSLGA